MIDKATLEQYNTLRDTSKTHLLCHTPFTTINFEQNGNMTACCYNRSDILGKYPNQSINKAWNSKITRELRKNTTSKTLSKGCFLCEKTIKEKSFSITKALLYDQYSILSKEHKKSKIVDFLKLSTNISPKVFEFELSNKCNLECVMCDGYWSSSIRANREKNPPLISPYDDAFVEQVAEYLPTLQEAKFLGGEPFLIDIYYKIWDKIIELNPSIYTHITTNGTILNARVKDTLEKLKCGIVISIDSIEKKNYEKIRKNASFERVMTNIDYFKSYTEKKGTYLCLSVCPMTHNWQEMPKMVTFANESSINIYFNNVWRPKNLSLLYVPLEEKRKIIDYWETYTFEEKTPSQKDNVANFISLLDTIKQSLKQDEAELKKVPTILEDKIAYYLKRGNSYKALNELYHSNKELFIEVYFYVILDLVANEKKEEVSNKMEQLKPIYISFNNENSEKFLKNCSYFGIDRNTALFIENNTREEIVNGSQNDW